MSQEVKREAEKPTESEPSTKCIQTLTDVPTVNVEPGPSGSLKPQPSSKTDAEESENEMDDLVNEYSDEDDSDNPDDYHPTIILDPYDDGDPYREPTDVGHLVINLGTEKKMDFEKDANGDYKCPEPSCKYIAKRKDRLARHYKIHGEKQYECRICTKKFAQRDGCMNHIRTHNDRYKFRCDECRKRFAVYQQLRKHSRDKHGIELESRRGEWIIVPPGYERPMVPLPRYNSRGKLW